jgi:UDP:flavonoid glycosyltransferase YjiC (YdhE family)
VPVSLASDQVFWADIIRRRGAGVASPQHAGALTAASFAQLLQKALGALPVLAAAAARLAEGVRAEPDGVGAAVGALRRVMAGEAIGKGLPAPAQAAA